MKQTSTVKARALLAGADDAYVAAATFHRLLLREPAAAANLKPGLACAYYEGSWRSLPDFDTLSSRKTAVADSVAIPPFARAEDFGVVLDGFVKIPRDGLYDFFLSADDGGELRVGDSLLVDNSALLGTGQASGAIALKAGMHTIAIRMFQKKGDKALALSIEGPGVARQPLPSGWLFHGKGTKERKKR